MEELKEKESKKRLDNIKEGEEFKGSVVKKKYFYDNNKQFIIFENEKEDVVFFGSKPITNISSIWGQCNLMKELTHSKKFKKWINMQKAWALNEFFLDNEEKSKEVLLECIETAKHKEKARKKLIYIGMYLGMVVFLLLCLLMVRYFDPGWQYIKYLNIMVFGSFGGFISLNTRLEKIEFSLYERTWSYILVSIYKITFACISSIIVYFLIESDMVLSALKDSQGIIYIAAVLAGFSESLLPNIFSGIEKDIVEKNM